MERAGLDALITAKVLFQKAQELCVSQDRFIASAGLVILQDAVELTMLACLVESKVDEVASLEKLTFDQLIGELRKISVKVIKSGSLKALNRERVLIKHYGQTAHPTTVRNYFDAASIAVQDLTKQVFGKSLSEIFLHELIADDRIRAFLSQAETFIQIGEYFDALVEIRKAFYYLIEVDYLIDEWANDDGSDWISVLSKRRGHKAAYLKKNKKWISENVRNPFDYVQYDYEAIKIDCLEWGVSTQELWNITRLTPAAMYYHTSQNWIIKIDNLYRTLFKSASYEMARYALEAVINIAVKIESYREQARNLDIFSEDVIQVVTAESTPLRVSASQTSMIKEVIEEGRIFKSTAIVPSLDSTGDYLEVNSYDPETKSYLYGYLLLSNCKLYEQLDNSEDAHEVESV